MVSCETDSWTAAQAAPLLSSKRDLLEQRGTMGISLVLHPAHIKFSHSQRPHPLWIGQTELPSDDLSKKLEELQLFADEEASTVGKLTETWPAYQANYEVDGVSISIPGQTLIKLAPFLGQLAYSTAFEPHECPQTGGTIVGVVAIGCQPFSANLAFQHLQAAEADEEACAQSAAWLFYVLASGHAAARPAAHSMGEIVDVLTQIGYIRHDFSQCYEERSHLGDGSFAQVYSARRIISENPSDQRLAAKVARPSIQAASMAVEASYLAAVQSHPNIIRFCGLFRTPQSWAMLLESCSDGDLKDYVIRNNQFAEEAGLDLVGKGLFAALSFIHSRNIIHRDIKPENVLVDRLPGGTVPYRTVLIDFGLACHTWDHEKLVHRCGSAGSVAPEVLLHSLQSPKADVFCGGVTLYYALGGKMPFRGTDLTTTLRANARARVRFGKSFGRVSEHTKDALRSTLFNDPTRRPSSSQSLKHFTQLFDLLQNSSRRIASPPDNVEQQRGFVDLQGLRSSTVQHVLRTFAGSANQDLQSASDCIEQPRPLFSESASKGLQKLFSESASTGLQTSKGSDQPLPLVSESVSTGLRTASDGTEHHHLPLTIIAPASPKPKRQQLRNLQPLQRGRRADGTCTSMSTYDTVTGEASSCQSFSSRHTLTGCELAASPRTAGHGVSQ
jgi:serine/threonine protein kinase